MQNEISEQEYGEYEDLFMSILAHVKHAEEKHPKFPDVVTKDDERYLSKMTKTAQEFNDLAEKMQLSDFGKPWTVQHILFEEMTEMCLASAQGDDVNVINESLDCIAVLVRNIKKAKERLTKKDKERSEIAEAPANLYARFANNLTKRGLLIPPDAKDWMDSFFSACKHFEIKEKNE